MDSFLLFFIGQDFQDCFDFLLCLFPDETGKFRLVLLEFFEARYLQFTSAMEKSPSNDSA